MAKDGFSAKIEFQELLSTMKKFPINIQNNIMVGATRAGTRPVIKEIRNNMPVKTGDTKRSIGATKRRTDKRFETVFSISPRRGPVNNGWKMGFIEWGTSKQPPNPIMRRAFESQTDESLTAMKNYIKVRIPKELAKAKR